MSRFGCSSLQWQAPRNLIRIGCTRFWIIASLTTRSSAVPRRLRVRGSKCMRTVIPQSCPSSATGCSVSVGHFTRISGRRHGAESWPRLSVCFKAAEGLRYELLHPSFLQHRRPVQHDCDVR